MQGPPSEAGQLRLARERIAALEFELADFRSATPTPTPPTATCACIPSQRPSPSPKPRPLIKTRRPSVAAVAAAVTPDILRSTSNVPFPTSSEVFGDGFELCPSGYAVVKHPSPCPDNQSRMNKNSPFVNYRRDLVPAEPVTVVARASTPIIEAVTPELPRPTPPEKKYLSQQTRYWTKEEHKRFLEAVAAYGEDAYDAISITVKTRTPKQVRTHAQNFQMKMARLAKRIEAGERIQMPAGMTPVVQVPTADGKSMIVPLPSNGRTAEVLANLGNEIPGYMPIIMALPPSKGQGEERDSTKSAGGEKEKTADALEQISSTVLDEMSDENVPAQTDPDPYMDYIAAVSDGKICMELEHTIVVPLFQASEGSEEDVESLRVCWLGANALGDDSYVVDSAW